MKTLGIILFGANFCLRSTDRIPNGTEELTKLREPALNKTSFLSHGVVCVCVYFHCIHLKFGANKRFDVPLNIFEELSEVIYRC